MGNCIRSHDKSEQMQWGGDVWDASLQPVNQPDEEEEELLRRNEKKSTPTPTTTEVKVKITKKQLEELLGKGDVQGMSVQQVLVQLMNVSAKYETQELRSWRPNLQTIHEFHSLRVQG